MVEWTDAAKEELERYLTHVQRQLASADVDVTEVQDDLKRHITEKAAASNLTVITKDDVSRIAGQMGLPETEAEQTHNSRPPKTAKPKRKGLYAGGLIFFGIILPTVSLTLEFLTGICGSVFFDPIPTIWHVLIIALVPLANLTAYIALLRGGSRRAKTIGRMNSLALGTSLFYSILFLPISPFAVMGIAWFGLGLIPLSPLLALICTFVMRIKLKALIPEAVKPALWKSAGIAVLCLIALETPKTLTRIAVSRAVYGSPGQKTFSVKMLRKIGSRNELLKYCYGTNRPMPNLLEYAINSISEAPSVKEIQAVYYLVTGVPYNAVKPPKPRFLSGSRMTDLSDWDFDQGGDGVAAKLRGLTPSESRLDGRIDGEACTAYTEWIMVFKNTSSEQREARAIVELPPNSVVSRVTLWIDGEEREAAYAGRAKVKKAYKKIVQRRRDPVLVTTYAPDRVMMQCFPVPPHGGTMKIKIGITSPLILESRDSGLLSLPRFTECNFSIGDNMKHSVWYESPQPISQSNETGSQLMPFASESQHAVKGSIADTNLAKTVSIKIKRNPSVSKAWTAAERGPRGFNIVQEIKTATNQPPRMLAIVIDGSYSMAPFSDLITTTVMKLSRMMKCDVFIAADRVTRVMPGQKLSAELAAIKYIGGCDNTPALEAAWDSALAGGGAVLWLHATQPMEIQKTEALLQRFERHPESPFVYDYQFIAGPNQIARKLDKQNAFKRIPKLLRPADDLSSLQDRWSGSAASFYYDRKAVAATNDISSYTHTDLNLARLWAKEHIEQLATDRTESGARAKAVKLATDYMLVTPVSGAVVLETAKQYEEAGLTPAESCQSPAVVPEPQTWALLLIGILVIAVSSTRKQRSHKFGKTA